jgi:transposase
MLQHGDRCLACGRGKVYEQKEPMVLVRIIGQAPLAATVYCLERLRCGACGQVFTAEEPEGVGAEKYDATAAAMIAQLKYGSGTPFYRLGKLEQHLGIPLAAATQWEIVEEAAELIKAARDELVRQAAQGEVLHNDDTGMRILALQRDASEDRTGVFTSGIVAIGQGRRIALYFTGAQHAGENLAEVLKRRAIESAPAIQMCDALSRTLPQLPDGVQMMVAHCLAHGRRQFVEVAGNFPEECRYVLEALGEVYGYDARAREAGLTAEERLRFHQQHSQPVMEELHAWMEAQFAHTRTEPNSGLGKAIKYLLRHWHRLTLFLRQAGAPLDNNIVERSLKPVILHRKNALFYRTLNGAHVGDLFMSLIHTAELCGANPFDYLTQIAATCSGTGGRPRRVAAVELPTDS